MGHLRHCALGAGCVVVLIAGCTTAKNTTAPPGDLHNFDPIVSFAAMASYAGPEARLLSMHAYFVRTDGTMDLTAEYRPRVDAEFVTKATAEDVADQGPLAPGSGFSAGAALRTQLVVRAPQMFHVTSGGSEWDEKHLGMGRRPVGTASGDERTIDPPSCDFKSMWQKALADGAPGDVVANIAYEGEGYTFEANGRDFRRRFDGTCNMIAEAK